MCTIRTTVTVGRCASSLPSFSQQTDPRFRHWAWCREAGNQVIPKPWLGSGQWTRDGLRGSFVFGKIRVPPSVALFVARLPIAHRRRREGIDVSSDAGSLLPRQTDVFVRPCLALRGGEAVTQQSKSTWGSFCRRLAQLTALSITQIIHPLLTGITRGCPESRPRPRVWAQFRLPPTKHH